MCSIGLVGWLHVGRVVVHIPFRLALDSVCCAMYHLWCRVVLFALAVVFGCSVADLVVSRSGGTCSRVQ